MRNKIKKSADTVLSVPITSPKSSPKERTWKKLGKITHLDIAALVDPLFACGGKRIKKSTWYST